MNCSEENLDKRPHFREGIRSSKPALKKVFAHAAVDQTLRLRTGAGSAGWKIFRAVISAEIGHDSDKRQELFFRRNGPSVQIGVLPQNKVKPKKNFAISANWCGVRPRHFLRNGSVVRPNCATGFRRHEMGFQRLGCGRDRRRNHQFFLGIANLVSRSFFRQNSYRREGKKLAPRQARICLRRDAALRNHRQSTCPRLWL